MSTPAHPADNEPLWPVGKLVALRTGTTTPTASTASTTTSEPWWSGLRRPMASKNCVWAP